MSIYLDIFDIAIEIVSFHERNDGAKDHTLIKRLLWALMASKGVVSGSGPSMIVGKEAQA